MPELRFNESMKSFLDDRTGDPAPIWKIFLISWENNRHCHITMPLYLKTMEVQIKREQWNNRFRTVQVYWIRQIGCRCFRDRKFYSLSVSAWSELGKERRRLIFAYSIIGVSPKRLHKKTHTPYIHCLHDCNYLQFERIWYGLYYLLSLQSGQVRRTTQYAINEVIPWDACGTPTIKIRFGCTQNCKASQ